MPSWTALTKYAALVALTIAPTVVNDANPAWRLLRPVIHSSDADKAAVMNAAPTIVLGRIDTTQVFEQPRQVNKPSGIGGPMMPSIPLYLARISAVKLLTMRGDAPARFEFYSWVWASGKHGGPRLFAPTPDSVHILFLKTESGYVHTAGDYPAYDIPLRSGDASKFIANWHAGYARDAGVIERIVATRIKTELDGVKPAGILDAYWLRTDLADLAGRTFVMNHLRGLCEHLMIPAQREAACAAASELRRDWRGTTHSR